MASSIWIELWNEIQGEFGKVLGGLIVGVIVALGGLILKLSLDAYKFFRRLLRAHHDVGRVHNSDGVLVEGRSLWLAHPIKKPSNYQLHIEAAKILMIANLKGGVCKTTLAANLGAYLSEKLTRPILLIDLDFQGTLSEMACPDAWLPNGGDSKATQLISGDLTAAFVAGHEHHAAGLPRLHVLGSYYDLAQAENRIMVEWLIGSRKKDIRYTLAEILHSSVVRQRFGLIIIDAPPRLTTASMQAICASSHLLIPTIMDRPSAETVVRFVRQIELFKGRIVGGQRGEPLNPHIRHLGVVGTMMSNGQNVMDTENYLRDLLNGSLENDGAGALTSLVDNTLYFHRSTHISSFENTGIAYPQLGNSQSVANIKNRIEALGNRIAQAMHLEMI